MLSYGGHRFSALQDGLPSAIATKQKQQHLSGPTSNFHSSAVKKLYAMLYETGRIWRPRTQGRPGSDEDVQREQLDPVEVTADLMSSCSDDEGPSTSSRTADMKHLVWEGRSPRWANDVDVLLDPSRAPPLADILSEANRLSERARRGDREAAKQLKELMTEHPWLTEQVPLPKPRSKPKIVSFGAHMSTKDRSELRDALQKASWPTSCLIEVLNPEKNFPDLVMDIFNINEHHRQVHANTTCRPAVFLHLQLPQGGKMNVEAGVCRYLTMANRCRLSPKTYCRFSAVMGMEHVSHKTRTAHMSKILMDVFREGGRLELVGDASQVPHIIKRLWEAMFPMFGRLFLTPDIHLLAFPLALNRYEREDMEPQLSAAVVLLRMEPGSLQRDSEQISLPVYQQTRQVVLESSQRFREARQHEQLLKDMLADSNLKGLGSLAGLTALTGLSGLAQAAERSGLVKEMEQMNLDAMD